MITWPVASLQPFGGLNRTISGHVPLRTRLSEAHLQNTPRQQIASANVIAAIRPDADLLTFPFDNYLAIGLRQRLVAPVLQSYSAGTPRLQEAYVQQIEQRKGNLEIIYGLDGLGVDPVDQVQDITRLPRVFDEFYRNFELKTPAMLGKGFVVLKPRLQPTADGDLRSIILPFTAVPGPNNSQTLNLATPASCSLIRLTSKLGYPITALIGRPARPGLKFSDGSTLVLDTGLISLEPGQSTATYLQLLDSTDFPKIFGSGPVPTKRWDKLQVVIRSTGFLDVGPSSFEVNKIECLTFAR